MKRTLLAIVIALGLVGLAVFAWRLHDTAVERGSELAQARCASCHDLSREQAIKTGPPLWRVVNRRAGGVPGYPYSEAFRHGTAVHGIVWSEANLDELIANPERLLPGSAMGEQGGDHASAFDGIDRPADRRALIRYLRTLD